MKKPETLSPTLVGHVRNGVIVLDVAVQLPEGQPVRIEPIPTTGDAQGPPARTDELERMKALFAQWDEEDGHTPDVVADDFHQSLAENRGLRLRTPKLD